MRFPAVVTSLFLLLPTLLQLPPVGAQEGAKSGTVQINGFEMYYEVRGTGEPLLLVHGWSGNAEYFEPLLDDLASHYRLIIPELRGHGHSTNPSGKFTTRQAADDVVALLDHLDVGTVRALGASAGALTLMHIGLADPTRIGSMILVGSGTKFLPHCRASMAGATADGYSPEWWEIMRGRHAYGDDQIRAMADFLPQLAAAEGDVAFTPELLASLEARAFIVHGDSDWCFPSSMAADMHEAIPESAFWVIPQGEHVPILGEWAPEFLRLALEFFEG